MTKQKVFSINKDDLEWSTFRGSGPGGQHRNKTDSAVRLHHAPSDVTVQCQSDRSQLTNKKQALKQLANHPKFRYWCLRRMKEIDSGETLEQKVEKTMIPENLQVEVQNEQGIWETIV